MAASAQPSYQGDPFPSVVLKAQEWLSPKDVDLVLYHKDCPDGFGAAWAAHKYLGDQAEYVAVAHGRPPPDVRGRTVAVFDYAFDRETHRRLSGESKRIVVIDHHKSAQEGLVGIPNCFFDMNYSGARLAWHYLFGEEPAPRFIRLIEDKDIWRWELPGTEAFGLSLSMRPLTFEQFDQYEEESVVERCIQDGTVLADFTKAQVLRSAESAYLQQLFSGTVAAKIINSHIWASEIGNEVALHENCDMGLIWSYDHRRDMIRVSLRSSCDAVDVSRVARLYGGGGHARAAGMSWQGDSIKALLQDMKNRSKPF